MKPRKRGGTCDMAVNIIHYLICFCYSAVGDRTNIFFHPGNKMVLERALDELVQNVGCEKLVYVCTGKVICEWL